MRYARCRQETHRSNSLASPEYAAEDRAPAPGRWDRRFLGAEASGALAATLVALPQALSLGVLAFAPLGPQYLGIGAAAAFLTLVIGNLAAACSYAVRCQMVGPRSATTALVAGLMGTLVAHASMQGPAGPDVGAVIAAVFVAIALAGALQLVLGLSGLGRAVKYVPYPVVAGFMNGIAIIIVMSQVRPLLGLEGTSPFMDTLGELQATRWGSLATAAAALAATLFLPRVTKRVPVLLGGLFVGIGVHYAIAALAPSAVGPVVGALPALGDLFDRVPDVARGVLALGAADAELVRIVAAGAALIAVVGALDGLLAAVICDGVTRGRHDSNRVLIGQGAGNLVGGFLGAMPAQINTHTPVASFQAGARTRLATVLHAVLVVVVLVLLAPAVARIPLAVLAGIMLYIAYSLVDRWSGELLRRIRLGEENRREIAVNVGIVAAVAVALVMFNVMAALAIGVIASTALLLVKLSQSPVRRRMDGTARASHKVRSPQARESLRALGTRIRILELQGELFFGTADKLQGEVDALGDEVAYVVLDFRRVFQIDATGARVLELTAQRAQRRGLTVVLSDVRASEARGRYLADLGVARSIPADRWFADLDRALEWAEDRLLRQARFSESDAAEIPPARMALFEGASEQELETVARVLQRHELCNGHTVFAEGDEGDRLYLISRGAVSIKVRLPGEERALRVATYAPGVMFGEMALIEGKRRSADAFAKGERVVLYSLDRATLDALTASHPALGSLIHRNLSRELAARLRSTSEQLRALE